MHVPAVPLARLDDDSASSRLQWILALDAAISGIHLVSMVLAM